MSILRGLVHRWSETDSSVVGWHLAIGFLLGAYIGHYRFELIFLAYDALVIICIPPELRHHFRSGWGIPQPYAVPLDYEL